MASTEVNEFIGISADSATLRKKLSNFDFIRVRYIILLEIITISIAEKGFNFGLFL